MVPSDGMIGAMRVRLVVATSAMTEPRLIAVFGPHGHSLASDHYLMDLLVPVGSGETLKSDFVS
jgi:hypothetical protein